MTTQDYLQSLGACTPALDYVGTHTLQEAWDICERPDYMWWLLDNTAPSNTTPPSVVEYSTDCDYIRANYTCPEVPE